MQTAKALKTAGLGCCEEEVDDTPAPQADGTTHWVLTYTHYHSPQAPAQA